MSFLLEFDVMSHGPLLMVLLVESFWMGANFVSVVLAGLALHSSSSDDSDDLFLNHSGAVFGVLLTQLILQIPLMVSFWNAARLKRSKWLLPYIVWRFLCLVICVVLMIVMGVQQLSFRLVGVEGKVEALVYPLMVLWAVSVAVSLVVAVKARSTWILEEKSEKLGWRVDLQGCYAGEIIGPTSIEQPSTSIFPAGF